ncbi:MULTISPECIES: putative leader peptide [unclassified Streptomyces]|uniref:putative leader peptide n=1 Tax=unclassified Streptomyces TaxID=2593676 RepID=UPI00381676A2
MTPVLVSRRHVDLLRVAGMLCRSEFCRHADCRHADSRQTGCPRTACRHTNGR